MKGGHIRLEKKHDGRWLVVSDDYLRAWWEPDCLDWAAYTALHFASVMNFGEPALGPGVPSDALERGRALAARLGLTSKLASGA
jgi:hypothetical protein